MHHKLLCVPECPVGPFGFSLDLLQLVRWDAFRTIRERNIPVLAFMNDEDILQPLSIFSIALDHVVDI
jgi:hypothetical protein